MICAAGAATSPSNASSRGAGLFFGFAIQAAETQSYPRFIMDIPVVGLRKATAVRTRNIYFEAVRMLEEKMPNSHQVPRDLTPYDARLHWPYSNAIMLNWIHMQLLLRDAITLKPTNTTDPPAGFPIALDVTKKNPLTSQASSMLASGRLQVQVFNSAGNVVPLPDVALSTDVAVASPIGHSTGWKISLNQKTLRWELKMQRCAWFCSMHCHVLGTFSLDLVHRAELPTTGALCLSCESALKYPRVSS